MPFVNAAVYQLRMSRNSLDIDLKIGIITELKLISKLKSAQNNESGRGGNISEVDETWKNIYEMKKNLLKRKNGRKKTQKWTIMKSTSTCRTSESKRRSKQNLDKVESIKIEHRLVKKLDTNVCSKLCKSQ